MDPNYKIAGALIAGVAIGGTGEDFMQKQNRLPTWLERLT